jgi:hypothetical protein
MENQIDVVKTDANKTKHLVAGIIMDVIGYLSYSVPFLAEISDLVWAPISGLVFFWMYKGKMGAVGGVFSFLEELLPGTDFIPSFTLMWVYKYIIKKN